MQWKENKMEILTSLSIVFSEANKASSHILFSHKTIFTRTRI